MGHAEQYLSRYAEPEAATLTPGEWAHGLVIPACDEGPLLYAALKRLTEVHKQGRLVVVVVINGRQDAPDSTHRQNARCARHIDVSELAKSGVDVLVVDRFSEGRRLPVKQGVGLARKIGCDVLVALHHRKHLSAHFIGSTDADALLPLSYFQTLSKHHSAAAITFPFEHRAQSPYEQAMASYELSLHHYVLGLQSAGSPYAFHTLGSSLAVSIESYVSGRGFPKRMAGEDFYLLNKVAKLGAVWRADGAPILLSGRPSHRVPFGTGPAIRRIQEAENEFKLFDPAVFDALSAVLQAMRTGGPLPHRAILEGLGYRVVERHLHKNRNEAQRLTHLHTWFDGFKTLKFIHQVRDALYPNLAWKTALEAAEWGGKPATSPELALTEMRAGPYATLCGSTPEALGR